MRNLAFAFFLVAGAVMAFAAFNSEGTRAYFWGMLSILEFSLALAVWAGWFQNFKAIDCPQCGTAQPTWRRPTSMRQTLFGGYTCAKCRCEMDRWGRALAQKAESL